MSDLASSPPASAQSGFLLACVALFSSCSALDDASGRIALARARPAGHSVSKTHPSNSPSLCPPGPSTWLLIQPYGNTVFAYRLRTSMYVSGQGFHFGIDLGAALWDTCGGHRRRDGGRSRQPRPRGRPAQPDDRPSQRLRLLLRPSPRASQPPRSVRMVQAGQEVALSGDPDGTCTSRPHLHLEIRDAPSHRHAFNPIPLIDADWNRIALASGGPLRFEQNLEAPQTWQSLYDQPDVTFGGRTAQCLQLCLAARALEASCGLALTALLATRPGFVRFFTNGARRGGTCSRKPPPAPRNDGWPDGRHPPRPPGTGPT